MLYYIKHEIIGDLVQHISDGVHVRFVKTFNIFIILHMVPSFIYFFSLSIVSNLSNRPSSPEPRTFNLAHPAHTHTPRPHLPPPTVYHGTCTHICAYIELL